MAIGISEEWLLDKNNHNPPLWEANYSMGFSTSDSPDQGTPKTCEQIE